MRYGLCVGAADIEKAVEIGYDYVVLPGGAVSAMSDEEFAQLEEQVKKNHIEVTAFNALCPPSVDICGPNFSEEKSREYLEKLAARGAKIGVKTLGIGSPFSRVVPKDYDMKLAAENGLKFTKIAAEIAAKYDMYAAMEAMNYKYCDYVKTIQESWEVAQETDMSNVGIVIDFFHMEAQGTPFEEALPLIPYARDLHISGIAEPESRPTRPFVKECDRARLEAVAAVLNAYGYDQTLSLEPDPLKDPSTFAAEAAESLALIRDIFG